MQQVAGEGRALGGAGCTVWLTVHNAYVLTDLGVRAIRGAAVAHRLQHASRYAPHQPLLPPLLPPPPPPARIPACHLRAGLPLSPTCRL